MNIKTQSIAIVASTLVLGLLFGFFLSRLLFTPPLHKTVTHERINKFISLHESLIQPTEAQQDSVRAILEKHYFRLEQMEQRHKDELEKELYAMHQELMPLLSEEQIRRLTQGPREIPHHQVKEQIQIHIPNPESKREKNR